MGNLLYKDYSETKFWSVIISAKEKRQMLLIYICDIAFSMIEKICHEKSNDKLLTFINLALKMFKPA